MQYVDLDAVIAGRPGGIDPGNYLKALPVLAPQLPAGAREFAADPEHYDFSSCHCVKDLAVSQIRFSEDEAAVEIGLRHDCWKHEDDLVICYHGVRELTTAFSCGDIPIADRQVILDEILPHEHGCSHEIACRSGSVTVVCRDLTATWIPAPCPDKPAGNAPGHRLAVPGPPGTQPDPARDDSSSSTTGKEPAGDQPLL